MAGIFLIFAGVIASIFLNKRKLAILLIILGWILAWALLWYFATDTLKIVW